METPSTRTLRLLSLLQAGGTWPAATLAQRLGVGERTVRRDAHRLRELGYDVHARPGPGAGYRLRPGVRIPPLLFTEDEVSAIVAGLAVLESWIPNDQAVAAALIKLDQVLPRKLRQRAAATALTTQVLQRPTAVIDWAVVGVLADAVATGSRVGFHYTDRHARESVRTVEPFRHVLQRERWYLVAFDIDRDDWRLFCLDRMQDLRTLPGTFRPHAFPAASLEQWLTSDFGNEQRS
ncbi:helix-turn-helix transcriptional regulator [Actinoalloteichus hymeniacidonis]|nr:YafY family protein [Actinoalloteichus hymeniacidonis]MBB5905773.1 putative DNA-binding transcriptional regulator YafY [Actinoalloteichus hymeniacidonis]